MDLYEIIPITNNWFKNTYLKKKNYGLINQMPYNLKSFNSFMYDPAPISLNSTLGIH